MTRLSVMPMSLEDANEYCCAVHRHLRKPVRGHKYSMAAVLEGKVVGVAIVGRPLSRLRQDGLTLEVLRLATTGEPNVPSFLYARCARAAFALGYHRIGTYIRIDEPGSSPRAAGWTERSVTRAGSWNRSNRPRIDKSEIIGRVLFETTSDNWKP